ncbi:RING finger domain protein [Rutstroemia sp. NJR-2017a WRK4]|nr:RING finger domain protein [Rutstroemia sp. NJR-2017a WRK4]PQE14748.1 RING finger domain protein [Rutstroemia sp. NJR-2017a WRK4]
MASAPPRPSSSSRQIAPQRDAEEDTGSSPPQASENSYHSNSNAQAYLLNDPKPAAATRSDEQSTVQPPQSEPQRCWICQMDDTEDGPQASPWRSPCPCSLRAHEECLMDWITVTGDKEMAPKIVCPVCKYQLKIDQPKDYIVLAIDKLRRLTEEAMLPLAVTGLAGCFYTGFLVYGINTLTLVFGADEAKSIMATNPGDIFSGLVSTDYVQFPSASKLTKFVLLFFPNLTTVPSWWTLVGLPLIAPTLVLSRTSIADPLFTVLPLTYFLFSPDNKYFTTWPPTPGRTFAMLPYIRLTYNNLYKSLFSDLEKKWELAVQRKPREGETAEQIAQQVQREEAHNAFFDVEVEIVEEVHQDPAQGGNVAAGGAQPAAGRNGEAVAPNQNQNGINQNDAWELRRNINASSIFLKMMGALFFPAVSSVMGDALKLALPSIWLRQRGLLQHKWGRSIIGGCLFVVLKDVVMLYCKWKKARDFGKKRVRDYVGPAPGRRSATR